MAEFWLPRLLQCRLGLHRRVAGARRGSSRAPGPRGEPRLRGERSLGQRARRIAGRAGLAVLALAAVGAAQAQVLSSRIWPAPDYTRLTIESKSELKYTLFGVKDPERLVL